MYNLTQFAQAAAEAQKKDLFGVLGINWKLLILQAIAFLILVWLLKKFVYPPLIKSLDERQTTIEESLKAAKIAEEKADKAHADIEAQLHEARQQSQEILAMARAEAVAQVEAAEAKAKSRAKRLTDQAYEQIQQDIAAARETLKKDTLELVALATEKVVTKKTTSTTDQTLIKQSLKEVEEVQK